jgi:hypothetical protein
MTPESLHLQSLQCTDGPRAQDRCARISSGGRPLIAPESRSKCCKICRRSGCEVAGAPVRWASAAKVLTGFDTALRPLQARAKCSLCTAATNSVHARPSRGAVFALQTCHQRDGARWGAQLFHGHGHRSDRVCGCEWCGRATAGWAGSVQGRAAARMPLHAPRPRPRARPTCALPGAAAAARIRQCILQV